MNQPENPLVRQLVRPEIRSIRAYQVPDATGLIKLDAMENPHVWPEAMKHEWLHLLRGVDVNRYPHPHAPELTRQLRAWLAASGGLSDGLDPGLDLLLGNGSDEIIQMLALVLGGPGRTILSVEPGFVMYRMIATFTGSDYLGVELNPDDFSLAMDRLLAAVEQHQPSLIFLAYPNNPTANLFDTQQMLRLLEVAPGLVVVDEAYAPFTDATFLHQLGDHPNLMVMRTLSKMGLAGLRLGLLVGRRDWLNEIDKVRLPYNINVLTQVSAEFALRHGEVLAAQSREIRRGRDGLLTRLASLPKVTVYPSQANFILIRLLGEGLALSAYDHLRTGGVLVKNLHGSHPQLSECLRLTIGTASENTRMFELLESFCRQVERRA